MLTDEFLTENAGRINDIVTHAETMGDGGPSLGTILLLALSDEDYHKMHCPSTTDSEVNEIVERAANRLAAAGIRVI